MSVNINQNLKIVKHRGTLNLAGNELPCYVLEDGTRVLSGRKMAEALKMVEKGGKKSFGFGVVRNLSQKSLKPFINKSEKGGAFFSPLICQDGGQIIHLCSN